MSKKPTEWKRTAVQNLLRNERSGRYYARWTIAGKQIWRALNTDVFGVAKLRLNEEAAKVEKQRGSRAAVVAGAGLMGDLMATYEERTAANPDLKPSSITSRLTALKKVRKTWPELAGMKPSQVTPGAVQAWATRFKNEGTNFRPPGAKSVIKGNSATSVNRAIDTLRRLFDIAIQNGSTHANPVTVKPAEGKLKKKVTEKKPELPSFSDVQRIFSTIQENGSVGGWGIEAADFARFLAYSGCRVGEVPFVTWSDVDWEKKILRVRGQKTETSDRVLPLFADLSALLRKIIERRKKAATFAVDGKPMLEPSDKVLRLSEAQKSIDRACASLGIPRITHHDFRHLFATRCIESGVDIPTVSRWLGHSDGGALAMRTYGHLRQEHSAAQAMLVNFGGGK